MAVASGYLEIVPSTVLRVASPLFTPSLPCISYPGGL
jgi:hypothetical protein